MDVLGFNLTDIVIVSVIVLSGIFAFARGLVKEILAILSWVGAALATFYGFQQASLYARKFITTTYIADITAGAVLFVVTLLILSLISHFISDRIRGGSLGTIDRSLGFVFGVARGGAVIIAAYLALTWAMPPKDQPEWLREAKTMPLIKQSADVLKTMVPKKGLGFGPGLKRDSADGRSREG
ncbi:MAG: CvpA family protein [Alphaproteobacteria bacterium]